MAEEILERMNQLRGNRVTLNLCLGEMYLATFSGEFSYEILSDNVYELTFDNSSVCLMGQEIKLVILMQPYHIKAVVATFKTHR